MDRNIYKLIDKSTGEAIFPGTITDGIAHLNTRRDLNTFITTYDVTRIWPSEGVASDGIYDLKSAILVLDKNLDDSQKVLGVTVKFLDINKEWETWEYCDADYEFLQEPGWTQLELDTIVDLQRDSYYSIEIQVEDGKSLVEVGTEIGYIEVTWDVLYKGNSVNTQCTKTFNDISLDPMSKNTIITIDRFNEYTRNKYLFTSTYHKMTKSVEVDIVAVHPSYYGIVGSDFVPTEEKVVSELGKILIDESDFSISADNLVSQKICYTFPAYLEEITEIRDENNINWVHSFTRSNLVINGVEYLCYLLTDPVSINKRFKLVFT